MGCSLRRARTRDGSDGTLPCAAAPVTLTGARRDGVGWHRRHWAVRLEATADAEDAGVRPDGPLPARLSRPEGGTRSSSLESESRFPMYSSGEVCGIGGGGDAAAGVAASSTLTPTLSQRERESSLSGGTAFSLCSGGGLVRVAGPHPDPLPTGEGVIVGWRHGVFPVLRGWPCTCCRPSPRPSPDGRGSCRWLRACGVVPEGGLTGPCR